MKILKKKRWCILTKNAIHGGVESLIKLEAERLGADIIVAGGLNNAEGTCPFEYHYVSNYKDLVSTLKKYEGVLYHWPPSWAVCAIRDSGIMSVEFVHRTDTAECDKRVPDVIVSHSQYVCEYIKKEYGRDCYLVPNVVDTESYVPNCNKKNVIGAVTSYYDTKGIDVLINAWAKVEKRFPEVELHLYGAGSQRDLFEKLAKKLKTNVYFHGPVNNSKIAYDEMKLVLSASRIEGLPIALLEALSCNVPILASDIEGHQIINQLALQRGLEAPIRLFKTEDADDLADKLCVLLNNLDSIKTNGREVALNVFSPQQHIEGLMEAFYRAWYFGKKKEQRVISLNCNKDVKLYLHGMMKERCVDCSYLPLDISNDKYFVAQSEIMSDADCVSIQLDVKLQSYCGVYIQVDWIYVSHVVSDGEGIYLDKNARELFAIKDIPSNRPDAVKFIVRPNPDEKICITHIGIEQFQHVKS